MVELESNGVDARLNLNRRQERGVHGPSPLFAEFRRRRRKRDAYFLAGSTDTATASV